MLPDYMAKQPDISGDMRAILVDWMVEVQVRGHGEGGMAFCRAAPTLPLVCGTSGHR